jgi:hypothetical protein
MHLAVLIVVISIIGSMVSVPAIASLITYFYGMYVYHMIHGSK